MNERKINNKVLYREILDYIMIAVGMLSYCIGWTIFLLPNNIATGGLAGLSSIIFWGTKNSGILNVLFCKPYTACNSTESIRTEILCQDNIWCNYAYCFHNNIS